MPTRTDFEFDVFLNHSSKDKEDVRPIARRLAADGLRVWFDTEQIKPGDNIPARIEAALERLRAGAFAWVFVQYVLVPRSKKKKVQKEFYFRAHNDLRQEVSPHVCRFSIKSCMFPILGGRLSARGRRTEIKYENVKSKYANRDRPFGWHFVA